MVFSTYFHCSKIDTCIGKRCSVLIHINLEAYNGMSNGAGCVWWGPYILLIHIWIMKENLLVLGTKGLKNGMIHWPISYKELAQNYIWYIHVCVCLNSQCKVITANVKQTNNIEVYTLMCPSSYPEPEKASQNFELCTFWLQKMGHNMAFLKVSLCSRISYIENDLHYFWNLSSNL